jgi:predicted Fe-S protein YdhL (DUF1289 family)
VSQQDAKRRLAVHQRLPDGRRHGFCVGCFRTIEEIAVWSRARDEQRLNILVAVERRRVEHDPQGCDCEPWGRDSRSGECER